MSALKVAVENLTLSDFFLDRRETTEDIYPGCVLYDKDLGIASTANIV